MTQNPQPPSPVLIHIDFAEPLDSEAYACRFRQEPAFLARTSLLPGELAEVRLADYCSATTEAPTVLVTRGTNAPVGDRCDCCHRTARGDRWQDLLNRIARVAGREGIVARFADELAKLTRREQDVLRLVGHGMSVSECAQALGVAESTIGNHKYRLMRKLGVTTSLQLLRISVRNGLADI